MMKNWVVVLSLVAVAGAAGAAEVLFADGPQEYQGRKYYWLAEWKLEVTLPEDVAPDDRFEVLFGSKGAAKRTLYYEYCGESGSLADIRDEPYEWVEIPLGKEPTADARAAQDAAGPTRNAGLTPVPGISHGLVPGKHVVLYGKGQQRVAFLAGVRVVGESTAPLEIKKVRTSCISGDERHAAKWSDMPGFEMTDELRRLWNPSRETPDWERAARSARYAGIALSKVQRWLHECCLPVRDEKSGLFCPRGTEWNYANSAADCYPFYTWAAY